MRKLGSDAVSNDPYALTHDSWEYFANSVLRADADRRSRSRVQTAASAMQTAVKPRHNALHGGDTASHNASSSSNSNSRPAQRTERTERSQLSQNPPSSSRPQAHLASELSNSPHLPPVSTTDHVSE
ncbi:hypothetical protein PQX77_016230 [Marasmius sp. AFHP31]|nr:hypothetical protein PQX77_016230 [Marasmius sp. AFHP31]